MAPNHEGADARPAAVYWVLFFGLCSFSMSPILVRLAGEAPGMTIAVWRTFIAAAALAPIALIRVRDEVRALVRRELALIIVAGVLLGVHFAAWIESLYHTTVASASVLVTTSPIFLAVLGYIFLRERLTKQGSAAIVLAVGGAVLMALGDANESSSADAPLLGNSLALGASLVFSIYLLVGRIVRQKISWLAYVFPLYTVASITVLTVAVALSTPLFGFSTTFYLLCAAMALGPQVLGHGSFNYAVRYVSAAMLGLVSLVEPVGASIIAYFLFGEAPGPLALSGMMIVLISVSFAVMFTRKRRSVEVHID